jgi:predicted PurR-regulated permease PerM
VVVVALCDSILVFIGLVILQVPMAPALAAIVFFGAFIPVIGAPIATFFAAIVALAERGPIIALLVIGLTVVVGSFDGDVMQPLVMGKAVSLNPLAIIILIAIGSILLGIIGALVAVPIGAAIYRVLKYLTGRDPDHPLPGESPPTPDAPAAPADAAPAADNSPAAATPATAATSGAATSQD